MTQEGPLLFTVTEVTNEYVFGRQHKTGRSVCARPCGFSPYFYSKETSKVASRMEVVQKTPLMGYHPNGPEQMYQLFFDDLKSMNLARNQLEHKGIPTYEASIKYVFRYMADMDFGGNDWVEIKKPSIPTDERVSSCDIEVVYDARDIDRLPQMDELGEQLWLSFDIEACKDGRGFVDPTKPGDRVTQIGMTLFDSHYRILDKRCLSLGPSVAKLPEGVEVEIFGEDERAILLRFRDYIVQKDVDVFTGYNINGFDWWYLFERAKTLGIFKEFTQFSKIPGRGCKLRPKMSSSAAKGARGGYELLCEGRYCMDMFDVIRDSLKLRSYSLGAVCKEVLNDSKVEMDYKLIPAYQAGTDEQRAHLCYYCWYDADLCRRLMEARMVIVNSIETGRVCGIPLKYLSGGQQNLTMSLLLRYGNRRGFVIPSSTESQNDEDTQGATVLEPFRGFYKCWIIVLDFQSLYPSIIRDRNLCYSTKVPLKWAQAHLTPRDYYVPPYVKNCNYAFVGPHIHRGILPQIETTLFNKRLEAKADLKREQDPQRKSVLDGRQLAIKVRMNSIYGFVKANKVCDKDLMETICAEGRSMIEQSKALIESTFPGSQVVYGDSVTGDTPCLVDSMQLVQICDLSDGKWVIRADGKEYSKPIHESVWTECGWTRIHCVIRHRTDKPIFRVKTPMGIVDCTADHGLVLKNGKKRVSIRELNVGDELLHSFPTKGTLGQPFVSISQRGKLKAAQTHLTLSQLGFKVFVEVNGEDEYVFTTEGSDSPHEILEIRKVTELYRGQYVYDLETENHHFHAGVGQLIVHNTDSVFVRFGDESMSTEEAFDLGERAARLCTELFSKDKPEPIHVLQREKGFRPFLLVGKKKYVGFKQMGPKEKPFVDSSGLETVRRDNAPIASTTMETCLRMIIEEGDYTAERAIAHVHDQIRNLLTGRVEIHNLIISKNLSKSWEHYAESGVKMPHVELAKKIKARIHETGEEEYHTGDRVKYVIVQGLKGDKSSACAEDPLYVLENRLAIDYTYYIENQMMKPLMRIFTPILAPNEKMTKTSKKGIKSYINDKELSKLTAYKVLFTGPHMMRKVQTGGGAITAFTVKIPTCIQCGCRSSTKLCQACQPSEQLVQLRLIEEERRLQTQHWWTWTRCQVCVKDKHVHEISCNNKDCTNFYERSKVIIDIEDLFKKM